MKRFAIGLAFLPVILLVLFLALFGVHRGRTHPFRHHLRVVPGSIASLRELQLGGVEQWVLIRGIDRTKPVVLFLHGGPGGPIMYLAHRFQKPIEREFVTVQWDQRGAGKSYSARMPADSLTVRRTLEDTYQLTRWLRKNFQQDRIYLVGHSWGSYIGMLAIREHPEYYRAFVGIGQVAGDSAKLRAVQRQWLMRAAFQSSDAELLDRLRNFGPIYETDIVKHRGEFRTHKSFLPALAASLRAPEYTWADILNIPRGQTFVQEHMRDNVLRGSLDANVSSVQVPVFFFLGAQDYETPSALALDYFRRLSAPFKRVVWFDRSAHFAFFEQPKRFARQLHVVQVETERYWARH